MFALGELLELVHNARRSLGSVQGTLREWRHEGLVGNLQLDYWAGEESGNLRWRPEDEEFEQLIDFKKISSWARSAGCWERPGVSSIRPGCSACSSSRRRAERRLPAGTSSSPAAGRGISCPSLVRVP